MSINRYSYKKLQQIMFDSVVETLESISVPDDKRLDMLEFRTTIFGMMFKKDPEIAEAFKDRKWVNMEATTTNPAGDVVEAVVMLDPYLENLFATVMEEFNEDRQDIVKKIIELTKEHEKFKLAHFQLEEFYTDEEVAEARKKARELLKKYAEQEELSSMKARMRMPSFPDIFDSIIWLEGELED